MEEKIKPISEFNAAVLEIQYLNNIWLDCRRWREGGQLDKVKFGFDSAESALTNDINEKQEKELDKINKEIEKSCQRKLYLALLRKERFLRKIQDKAGKGAKYRDPYEDEMD